jgi:hypothetical protein
VPPLKKAWSPGGGVALIRGQKALDKLEGANEDQAVGIRNLLRSRQPSAVQTFNV